MMTIKETKLNELLKGITYSEYKHFGDFINSPFHNKSQTIIKLYDYLKKYSKEFGKHELTNEELSISIYNDKDFNSVKVRSLVSDFVKLIEKFFITIQFESSYSTFQRVLLLYELNMRDLPKNFKSVLNDTMKKQKDIFGREENYYYNQVYLEVESFNYFLERRPSIEEESFKKIADNIDFFFILTKLNLFHFMNYHRQNVDEASSYNLWLMNEILEYLENNLAQISKYHPVIYLKYLILMTIIKPYEENYFVILKKFILKNFAKFDNATKFYIFGALTNYCMTKCNMGELKYKQERYKIFKILDDKGIFEDEKFLNYSDFLNAIISSLEVNKISWAEYFFKKNKERIMPSLKEDTLNMARSEILYAKKNYDEALRYLNMVSYNNHYFYLRSKMILSRIYYEKNDLEPIEYIIDAAKHYIKRNKKLTKMNHEAFGNFFVYMKKILYLREHLSSKTEEIQNELKKETIVSSKEWLINKFKEIEKM